MSNLEIARLLRTVAAAYIVKDEKKFYFQIVAYQRAADAIEHATSEVKDLWDDKKLDTIAGVGESIAGSLDELFRTGKVKHFEEITKDLPKSLFPLLDIPKIGPKTAYKLVTNLRLDNAKTVVDDLEKKAKAHLIAELEGFGDKSEADILRSIDEYKKGLAKSSRMLLPYAYELAQKILDHLKASKDVIRAESLGSLRRMASTIGDIDIAVSTKNPKSAIDWFTKFKGADRIIEKGKATASIIVSGNRQVDLMVQGPDGFGALLQHFTGSKHHNIHLREKAQEQGLSLSEYGIKVRGKLKEYQTEEDFYEALGMDWIPPEIRENNGEIERALAHKLPELVEPKDIKGDLHIHTNFNVEPSHDLGTSPMEDIVITAKELEYEYIGFSDHNPSVGNHEENQIIDIIKRRTTKIEQIKQSTKFTHIFNLLEVDILASGELAVSEKGLSLLDGAIVSIHSSMDQPRKTMTKRILEGLKSPHARILAHPTGRILNQREGYEVDWYEIFDFCKENNKAIEINAFPNRLDLPDTLVKEAIRYGVKLVINTDSHDAGQMGLLFFGVSVARRGWATKGDIINTLDYNKFNNWLGSR